MLRNLLKKLRKENGQSAVMFGLLLPLILGVTALVIDAGIPFVTKVNLQSAADAAALAAAGELPSTADAIAAAKRYAGLNGVEPGEIRVTVPYRGDSNQIEVVCTRNVPYTFARIFGLTDVDVSARAVAARSGMDGAFGYAVFSGDPNFELNFYGSNTVVNGGVHSNQKLTMYGSNIRVTGVSEAASDFTMNGSYENLLSCRGRTVTVRGENNQIGTRTVSAAAVVEMPDFSDLIKAEAEAAGQVYHGDKTFNGCNVDVRSSMYIDGNLTINGDRFSGNGAILVSGNITFNGSNISSGGASVCFYSQNGNIIINGDGATLDGLVYAPNGAITVNGSRTTFNGRVIGARVFFNGDSYTVSPGSQSFSFMESGSVKLTE